MLFFPRLTTIQTVSCLALAGSILLPTAARADLVLLKDGRRIEGVVAQTPGKTDSVTIRSPKGSMELSKDLIQTIQYESEAVNLRRTGDDHYNAKRYKEAVESYQKSLAIDPKDELTAKQLKMAQDAIASESTVERRKQLEVINLQLDETKKKIAAKDFDGAEKVLLKEIPPLNPTDEQTQQINEVKKSLYLAWAYESDDKLKPELALKYYEKVLELDATNKEAYEHLLKVMEKNPLYNQRVIDAYRVQLKLNGEDSITRRKLADKLLEEGVRLDREATLEPAAQKKVDDLLKESVDTYQLCVPAGLDKIPSGIAEKMVQALEPLYKRAEGRSEFGPAAEYYARLMNVSDKTDKQTLFVLRYREELEKLAPGNKSYTGLSPEVVDQVVALTQRATNEWKLEAQPRETFSVLKRRYPAQPSVIAAQKAVADGMLMSASNAHHEMQYAQAMKLSMDCMLEYASVPGVKDRAEQIYNLAKVENDKVVVVAAGNAKKYKEEGDDAYQKGMEHLQNSANDNFSKSSSLAYKPIIEAQKSFNLALEKYQQALKAVASGDTDLKAEITRGIANTQAKIKSMNRAPAKFAE